MDVRILQYLHPTIFLIIISMVIPLNVSLTILIQKMAVVDTTTSATGRLNSFRLNMEKKSVMAIFSTTYMLYCIIHNTVNTMWKILNTNGRVFLLYIEKKHFRPVCVSVSSSWICTSTTSRLKSTASWNGLRTRAYPLAGA